MLYFWISDDEADSSDIFFGIMACERVFFFTNQENKSCAVGLDLQLDVAPQL